MQTEMIKEAPGRALSKEPEAKKRPAIQLTENQKKVIADKYLKEAPSVEAWLGGVARNIALAELLYHPKISRKKILEGVCYQVVTKEDPQGGVIEMILLHRKEQSHAERAENFSKFLKNLYDIAEKDPIGKEVVEETEERFYHLLSNFYFLPNSPTLMNAGRQLQQLSACYVLPVPDSMEGIFEAVKNQAIIHQSGGGTGFSFGRLRPKDDEVKSTKGIASGPISFMKIFDVATEQVKQGGTRRGANMAILPYWHPNIVDFITMKNTPGVLENFNISVGIDEKFIKAMEADGEIELINPRTQKVTGKMRAQELFDLMIDSAWKSGDPGYVVLDRINNSGSNPTPAIGQIEATNPCGEQPLLPNEPCNLGSINLSKFVTIQNGGSEINYPRLRETVYECTHFLDNVIDVNNYPIPEIEEIAKGNRRIGLGVMGWAETLVKLGIPYDSEEAIQKAEEVMEFINRSALEASEELAKERGVFPNFKESIYDETGPYFRGERCRPRNCARTTIAPTGTIAITAGLQGSGIEPFFAISYTRYNARGLDAIKKGEKPKEEDTFTEVNPLFKRIAEENHYFGLTPNELWKKIDENHKSVRGIPEIPKPIQRLFATSHDVSFDHHIRVQAAFQKHTDNAVSKTINCPNNTTREELARAYMLAYELGCKGLTIYRDGSKAQQVLNLKAVQREKGEEKKTKVPNFSEGVTSEYYEKKTGYGTLHMNIIYTQDGPYRIFTNLPPIGTEVNCLTAVIGILLSKYFEAGGDPERILKHLNSAKGDRPYGFGPSRVDSVPHAISQVLRDHLKKTGKLRKTKRAEAEENTPTEGNGKKGNGHLKAASEETPFQVAADYCPRCYSSNVEFVSGCKEPTCFDCGYSNCS